MKLQKKLDYIRKQVSDINTSLARANLTEKRFAGIFLNLDEAARKAEELLADIVFSEHKDEL